MFLIKWIMVELKPCYFLDAEMFFIKLITSESKACHSFDADYVLVFFLFYLLRVFVLRHKTKFLVNQIIYYMLILKFRKHNLQFT